MAWIWWSLGAAAAGLGGACLAERWLEARDRRRFPAPGRMVDVGGGRRLHLYCKGAVSGPSVVIEQGAGSPSILWWPIQDRIAAVARACTYDRAGYQWSDNARRTRSLAARVDDLHAVLMRGAVPGPYVLVGHSYGGPVIRCFARRYPELVAGMVLVDTPEEGVIFRASYKRYAAQLRAFAWVLEAAARLGLVRLALRWMTDLPDGLGKQAFAALKANLARADFFRAMADDPVSLGNADGFGGAGEWPLVVITHGVAFPGPAAVLEDGWAEGQARLAQLSPQGRLTVARESNHMVHADQPAVVIDAILSVIAAVKGEANLVVPVDAG